MKLDQILNGGRTRIPSPLLRGGVAVLLGVFPAAERASEYLEVSSRHSRSCSFDGMGEGRSLCRRFDGILSVPPQINPSLATFLRSLCRAPRATKAKRPRPALFGCPAGCSRYGTGSSCSVWQRLLPSALIAGWSGAGGWNRASAEPPRRGTGASREGAFALVRFYVLLRVKLRAC